MLPSEQTNLPISTEVPELERPVSAHDQSSSAKPAETLITEDELALAYLTDRLLQQYVSQRESMHVAVTERRKEIVRLKSLITTQRNNLEKLRKKLASLDRREAKRKARIHRNLLLHRLSQRVRLSSRALGMV